MAANPKRKPVADELATPSAPAIQQEPADDAARKAEHAQLRLSIRAARSKARQRWEEARQPDQQNQIEENSQTEHNEELETTSLLCVDKPSLLERVSSLLAEEGFSENVTKSVTQLIEIAANDPPLFAAKIAAAEKVQAVTPPAGRPPKLTHAQREDIRQRRVAGEQVNQLAESFGVDRATIFRITHEGGQKKAGTRL